jgi:hypothetical protein
MVKTWLWSAVTMISVSSGSTMASGRAHGVGQLHGVVERVVGVARVVGVVDAPGLDHQEKPRCSSFCSSSMALRVMAGRDGWWRPSCRCAPGVGHVRIGEQAEARCAFTAARVGVSRRSCPSGYASAIRRSGCARPRRPPVDLRGRKCRGRRPWRPRCRRWPRAELRVQAFSLVHELRGDILAAGVAGARASRCRLPSRGRRSWRRWRPAWRGSGARC